MNYVYPTTRRSLASLLPTLIAWAVLVIVATAVTSAAMHALDAQAQEQAQHIAEKRAAQKKAQQEQKHATKLDRIAAEVCRESHGPDAVHWWDSSGVLVCAATKVAMDTAAQAVATAQQAIRGQRQ